MLAHDALATQILRFAQNDMPTVLILVSQVHYRHA